MEAKIKNNLLWYLIICFTVSTICGLDFWNNSELLNPLNSIVVYLPGILVLLLTLFTHKLAAFKSGYLGFSLKGFKYWILAPTLMTTLCFLSYGASIVFNPELIKSKTEILLTLESSGFYFGHFGFSLFAISLVNIYLGSLVNILAYLGQELGWRAFVQTSLQKILNPLQAFLVGGIIWGIWTFFFLGHVFIFSNPTIIGCILTVLFCIPVGIIFQYFYRKSQSIFVAALAHAALYKSTETAALVLNINEMNIKLSGPVGITGIMLFWIVALILLKQTNR